MCFSSERELIFVVVGIYLCDFFVKVGSCCNNIHVSLVYKNDTTAAAVCVCVCVCVLKVIICMRISRVIS